MPSHKDNDDKHKQGIDSDILAFLKIRDQGKNVGEVQTV